MPNAVSTKSRESSPEQPREDKDNPSFDHTNDALSLDVQPEVEETSNNEISPKIECETNQHDVMADSVGPLYKSSRLRGYITLALASFINFDAADNSSDGIGIHVSVITSTPKQRGYADAVSLVSLVVSAACFIVHLDRLSPLQNLWQTLFKPGSKFEGLVLAFLTAWWSVAAGVNTSIRGLAGDGRGQFSLYYSTWVCCFTCYWMVERWGVAAGLPSFKSFIDSWPNRAPAWICFLLLSMTTANHDKLQRPSEALILSHFKTVSQLQWQWLVIVTFMTFCPSIVFVLIELFRGTNPDGSITNKSQGEIVVEGCCFLALALAWIPTVMIATTPRGAASLIGNAYFCTWTNAIAVCEGLVWFIHDKRRETHELLQRKRRAYIRRQDKVMEEAMRIQKGQEQEDKESAEDIRSGDGNRTENEVKNAGSSSDLFGTARCNSAV